MNGRKSEWTADYTLRSEYTEAEAVALVSGAALRDVPDATVEIVGTRKTPKGRIVVTVRRIRA